MSDIDYGKVTRRSRPYGVTKGVGKLKIRNHVEFNPYVDPSSYDDDREYSEPYSVSGTQYTESEGHPFHSSKDRGMTDLGGEFFTQKSFCETVLAGRGGIVSARADNPPIKQTVSYIRDGPVAAIDPMSVSWPTDPDAGKHLDELGTTAIALVKPTNPVAGLTAALSELRMDGLPHLPNLSAWEQKAKLARNSGGEYLNAQFGWLPLVSDISDFARGVHNAHSLIEGYKRNIGMPIRRSYHFPQIRTIEEETIKYFKYPWRVPDRTDEWTSSGARSGTLIRSIEVTRDRWFSGCFTYFFPKSILGSEKLADYAILAKKLGVEPTPEVLWQITPWSWAIDWFSNTGDVISNYSSFLRDGLVLRYGYMMEHSVIRHNYSLVGTRTFDGVDRQVADVNLVIETKIRRRATPYGFGLNWDGFSAFQSSILAALGLSRVGRR